MDDQARGKKSYQSYTVAVVCAMSFEMSAVRYMLDREHPRLQRKEGDANTYVLGELYGHNIVLACLPGSQGKGSAATVATNLARTFPAVALRFLVGIGGGVPSEKHDIRLGDVVVSMPSGQYGGVVQYDLGRATDDGFFLKGFLWPPPPLLRSAVETMRSDHLVSDNKIGDFVASMLRRGPRLSVYQQPPVKSDVLFEAAYSHPFNQPTCGGCDHQRAVQRRARELPGPEIHYGLIASGDTVMRTANSLAMTNFGDVLCFEMEAAGLMTEYSCIVIRGISDYADSHKNDEWHFYAAATAAACAKELLSYLQPDEEASNRMYSRRSKQQPSEEIHARDIDHVGEQLCEFHGSGIQHSGQGNFNVQGNVNIAANSTANSEEAEECTRGLFITDPYEDREALKRKKGNRASGTCEWILDTEELSVWLDSEATTGKTPRGNVLWLHGNPGTGKSTMAIYLTEALSKEFDDNKGEKALAYFFCDASFEKRKTATSIMRGLLYQLTQKHRKLLLDYVLPQYKVREKELFKSFEALWEVFVAAAADQQTGEKYCIIDALDECDKESQETLLYQLQETFQSHDAPLNVHILITSRPLPEIRECLEDFTARDLASFHQAEQDIDRCIEARVNDLAKRKRYTAKVKDEICYILRSKAEGTFLWVGLACEELKGKPSKDAIRFLQEMPKGLSSLYGKLLETAIDPRSDEEEIVRRILGFVAVSYRLFSVLELSDACRLHQDEEDTDTRLQYTRDQIASCRLLVVIQDEYVQLLHQSVRDFLVGTGSDSFIDRLEAHAGAAYRCVDFLVDRFHNEELRFKVGNSQIVFFSDNSPSRDLWLKNMPYSLYRMRRVRGFPRCFSLLHVAALWGIPALVEYALGFGDQTTVTRESAPHAKDVDCRDANGYSPLEVAVQSRHPDAVGVLLRLGANVDEGLVRLAVKRSERDTRAVQLLLDRHGYQITITEDIINEAAGNWQSGKELMSLFLERYGSRITIREGAMKAAAGNHEQGRWITQLLVHHQGNQITITEDIIKNAARNSQQGKEIIQLLLQHQGNQITITEDIIKNAARNRQQGKEIVQLLLWHQGGQIDIVEAAAKVVAKYSRGTEMMQFILQQLGESRITVTEEMVEAAAENRHSNGPMQALLQHCGNELPNTERVLQAATRSEALMDCVLNKRVGEITITEEVVKAAAATCRKREMMKLLLQHEAHSQITITEQIVMAAATKPFSREPLELLLEERRDEFTITEEMVNAVVAGLDGRDQLELLLVNRGDDFTITEEIVKAAVANYWDGRGVFELLLDQCGDEFTITEEIVKAAAANYWDGVGIFELLLEKRGDEFTITEEILKAVVANDGGGRDIMELLIEKRGDEFTITEEMVELAQPRSPGDTRAHIIRLFDKNQERVAMTEGAMAAIDRFLYDE
ncbi:hypothetical protein Trco_007475 [Trichoderma cornu-damae]|uniref:NACHT domain-containing protein n=1 Tax=Trichoderma cornu-damae TaxID=654480 RepID=A0A9P8TUD5_9HYPO|nr:hypothetical protein Trco_007475 [Trichoderma cornu-damae]